MADMSPITASIDGVSHTFTLLEADIPGVTFHNAREPFFVSNGADFSAFKALTDAIGINWNGSTAPSAFFAMGVFTALVDPKGAGDYVWTRPTGKALLARAAVLLADARQPWPDVVRATLAVALKGAGLDLKTAAGIADNLARSSQSSPGKFSYTQSVLVPQILSAAAAA